MRVKARILYFFLLVTFLLPIYGMAQQPGFQWLNRVGGDGGPGASQQFPEPDFLWDMVTDKEGNVYTGGSVTMNPTFNATAISPPYANFGNRDFYLAKYNACGDLLWVRVGGGSNDDGITGIDVDDAGNIYCVGYLPVSNLPGYIKTPAKDTSFLNTYFFFAKFSSDGNLLLVKPYNSIVGIGYLKLLHNGQLQAAASNYNAPASVGNFNFPTGSKSFVRFDTLGNIINVAFIDSGLYGNGINGKFTMDDKDNTYFRVSLSTDTQISVLDTLFKLPAQSSLLIRADKNFNITAIRSAYRAWAFANINYANGSLFTSGRDADGAIFNNDTTHLSGNLYEIYTAYRLDTNFNTIWRKRPAVQTYDGNTELISYPTGNSVYLSYLTFGTLQWDTFTLTVPINYFNLALVRLDAETGTVLNAEKIRGNTAEADNVLMASGDANGNGFFAGNFHQSLIAANDTIYSNGNFTSPDHYLYKWGLPCTDTLNSLDAPAAPQQLVATAVSTTGINISWGNFSGNHLGFNLYRSPNGTTGWQQIANNTENDYSYSDQGLTPNTTYWYKVAAYTSTGGEGLFSNIDSATTLPGSCQAVVAHISAGAGHTFTVTGSGTAPFTYAWSNNGTAFTAGDTAMLTLIAAGSYNICVTVTDADNCIATDCETVIVSSIEPAGVQMIELYPNPTVNMVYMGIEVQNASPVQITVYDFSGRQVLRTTRFATGGKNLFAISTTELAGGIYPVVVRAGDYTWHGKISKVE